MPPLYAIIIWNENDAELATPMPYCESHNNQAALRNYKTLEDADGAAFDFEKNNPGMQARVISLDSVHE